MGIIIQDGKYCCARLRVYTYLKSRGFREVGVKPDKNNPRYCVWFFDRTEKLSKTLDEYFANNKH